MRKEFTLISLTLFFLIAASVYAADWELDTTIGVISGKPRRIGQHLITIHAIDADGLILQRTFTLSISRRSKASQSP